METARTSARRPDDVSAALAQLRALHQGYAGVHAAIACGPAAIAPLQALLTGREPSGLFEIRVRAARALASLGAIDALIGFLQAPHDDPDPVAQAGEDATIDGVARALVGASDPRLLSVLIRLAFWRPLCGVMEGLAALNDPRAIPGLISGLREDHTHRIAEDALMRLGAPASPLLLAFARPWNGADGESAADLRARRRAMRLATEIGVPESAERSVEALLADRDPEIAALACSLCLSFGNPGRPPPPTAEQRAAS